ncbi:MAG: Ig-like domain-containing protein [Bacteroidetes bacterium]|nr:Ig-like domain-containing protein [Bacteroidota bacterium]
MKNKIYLFFILLLTTFSLNAQVVINEVYGGGGNSGSTYKNDFIELFNNGNTAVNLNNWSVQYASYNGSTWSSTPLSGSIPAHGYYLIQEAAGSGGTTSLPTPDATGSLALSASNGKVALVSSTTALTGSCPTGGSIIDFVGFGTANCYEGTAAAPAPSASTSIQRTPIGADNNQNSTDFTSGSPSPVNSTGAIDVTPPTISSLTPINAATNVATTFTATVTFNEAIIKGTAGTITLKKVSDNSVIQSFDILDAGVIVSASNLSFNISGLAINTSYYLEISSGTVTDISGNAFAGISGSSTWSFTTGSIVSAGIVGNIYDFNTCTGTVSDGFVQYSVTGPQIWGCTTFGRDPANPSGTAAYPYAVQINGFSGTNILNEDWLISPAFDLTSTTYPLLSFWSRTAFNGAPLTLKVSTDYPGSGNPNSYTWTDLNGHFPGQTSNIWTQSQNINLSAFKSANTYFAFVYHSSNDDGARWTIDDVSITNSSTPPPPSLTSSTLDIDFNYVANGSSAVKTFTLTGNDITGPITLTSTGKFLISKTNGSFTNSISYTQAEANNIPQVVYVQFSPDAPSLDFSGNITISTPSVTDITENLKGNSIDPALTLDVVNWNLEWFGSTTLGPSDDNQQEANVKTITQNIGADLFGLVEVVDESRLQNVVANLNSVYGAGTYAYVICNYGSHANPFESGASPLSEVQKEAFVYKTSVISPIGTPGPLVTNGVNTAADLTNPAYNYFSSGRYPYMMNANVTLGGVTKQVRFVLLHAKANTSPTATSYARRKSGSDTLNYTLNNLYPNDNIMVLGDYNDDLDQSITAGFTTTSYSAFTTDVTDFFSPTLALSLAGKKSTVSYNDMIDHVMVSNELQPYYMGSTASVLTDVTSLVSNYGNTTSDHYPVFTRYAFDASLLPVNLVKFNVVKLNNTAVLSWTTAQEINSKDFVIEKSTDGITWTVLSTVNAAGNSTHETNYTFTDNNPHTGVNSYRLRQVDKDNKFTYSLVRTVVFNKAYDVKITPNPASDFVKINFEKNNNEASQIIISNALGKTIEKFTTYNSSTQVNISKYATGIYFIKTISGNNVNTQKIVKQ